MSLHEFLNFGSQESAPVSLDLGIEMPQQTQELDLGVLGSLDLGMSIPQQSGLALGIEVTGPLDLESISGTNDIQELDLGITMMPQISIQSPSNETTNISAIAPTYN